MKDFSKKTPLHCAVEENNINAVKILHGIIEPLLKAESNIDEQDIFGWTPLHFAAKYGHLEIVKTLLDKGAGPF